MSGRRRAAGLLLLAALSGACAEPAGPAPVPWDRATCARCRMLVGEPAFAAQVLTGRGERLYFDDPGGLLLWLDEEGRGLELEGAWFRHLHRESWIALEQVAFERVEPTPMGFGLGAVERDEGEISLDEARRHARELERLRHRGGAGGAPGPPPAAQGAGP